MQPDNVLADTFRHEAQEKILESLYQKTRLNYQQAAEKILRKQEAISEKEIRYVYFQGKEYDLRMVQDFVTEIVTLDPSLHEEMKDLNSISKDVDPLELAHIKNYLRVVLNHCKTPGDIFELLPYCLHDLFHNARELVDTYPPTTTKALFMLSNPKVAQGEAFIKQRIVLNEILS